MAASPRNSLTGVDMAVLMALAPSMATDDDSQCKLSARLNTDRLFIK